MQPLFHAESLNVKQLMTSAKSRKVYRATLDDRTTIVLDALFENLITFIRMWLFLKLIKY